MPANPIHRFAAPLFMKHHHFRMCILAALEGNQGKVIVDDKLHPTVGFIRFGDLLFVAGDEKRPFAYRYLRRLNYKPTILTPSYKWRTVVKKSQTVHKWQRVHFAPDSLRKQKLQQLAAKKPASFTIETLTRAQLDLLPDIIGENPVDTFASLDEFMEKGFGFVMLAENGDIASVITTFGVCSRGVEIQINTAPAFLRQGLATALSAHMLLHCHNIGLEPHWDAHNAASAALATRLGYTRVRTYESYVVQ